MSVQSRYSILSNEKGLILRRMNSETSNLTYNSNDVVSPSTRMKGGGSTETAVTFKFDQEHKKELMELEHEYKEQLTRQRLSYEVSLKAANDENTNLRQQLTSKDIMIQEATRKVTELSAQFKMQKLKLMEDWEGEKAQLMEKIGGFEEGKEDLLNEWKDKLNVLQREREEIKKQLDGKIKRVKILKKKNNELQMIVDQPPQSSCYSVSKWFNR